MSMAGPLLALEDEAPLVAVTSCLIVTSSSPIRQNFSGGRSHSCDTARLWLDEEGCSCFLASTRACSLARYSLPSSFFSSSAPILSLHVSVAHLGHPGVGPYFLPKPLVTCILFNVSMLGGPFLRLGIPRERLSIPPGTG